MLYSFRKSRYTATEYANAILERDITMLSKTITLVESNHFQDNRLAEDVIEKLFPYTGNAIRIGITGVPGAGKSTFIDTFGMHIINEGKRPAVLSIDPSSPETHGSILGDKTRMEMLSANANAYIRPSAAGHTLGGIHSKTREAMLLCEAAGFDVIIIETVGVGQNETRVRSLVDFFLLMLIAGGGDELQGIKRGIVEAADAILINKADGENLLRAQVAKQEYETALHLLGVERNHWAPQVRTCSALTNEGIDATWQMVLAFQQCLHEHNAWQQQREDQQVQWMKDILTYEMEQVFRNNSRVRQLIPQLESSVRSGTLPAVQAAKLLMQEFITTQ